VSQSLSIALNGFVFWLVLASAATQQARRWLVLWCAGLFALSVLVHVLISGTGQAISVAPDLLKGYGSGFWSVAFLIDPDLPPHISPFHLRLVEQGWIGIVLLYLPCGIVAFNFIRALSHPRALYALGGLCVMLCLALADYFLVSAPAIQAVWLSGWALVGGLYTIIGKNSLT
jgi:hypothetical protein